MTGSAQPELDFGSLIGELAALRTGPLKGQPSARTLAKAANFSPTTICNWLRAGQFPQEIDPLLAVVRAVRLQAEAVGLADAPATVAVLDEQQWRRAFQAEVRRRAQGTSAAVEAAQSRSVLERIQPGLPLQEVTDPFHLEVKRAIEAPRASQSPLPAYVPREHDQALATVVDQAADGENGLVVLVGESSTGKTRALWEALNRLRTRDEPWRLWHPIDRQRPTTPLTELTHLPPYTVVWLNEAQLYLDSRSGEQIASGLRTRLRDAQRAPVLVLATLWTEHWNTLTTRPPGAADVHSQARELLNGRRITVPSTFAGADLAALAGARGDDPRLGEAADHARDGHVIQYLAGGPVLLDRYRDAPPTTRALIDTAMDARRLGAGPHIPSAWLAHAAPGYLTESEWEHRSDDWFEQALAYVTTRHNGISAILTPVKTSSPRNQRATGRMSTTSSSGAGHRPQAGQDPLYRLADYLDQYGRHHRAEQIPPVDFWTAAAAYAHPTDLPVLGDAAACTETLPSSTNTPQRTETPRQPSP
ncbi:ATP-binding protein [Streptomyces tauricus]|uniref:ATP-binding protein n=1 Tax=Streptomyces tauricus TaxID=68274 RepID=UPI0022442A41|nr:ATP-binding protein [Streptomyces tauricus]MCW8102235.1 ATP-binding protein [Streptomyces tauricus]